MNEINNQLETGLDEISDQLQLDRSRRAKLRELQARFGGSAKDAAYYTDRRVHEYAWTSIAIAMGLGLALGALISMRRA